MDDSTLLPTPDIQKIEDQRFRVILPPLDYLKLFGPHRAAEVAMVIERKRDWVLVQTKTHYPPGIFRLPTGTVEKGETTEAAMLRELKEEANLSPGRFWKLFRLEYHVEKGRSDFFTDAFFIESPEGELKPVDFQERISAWREASLAELPSIAEELRSLEAPRRGWGLFRSLLHDLVYQSLAR